MNILFVIASLGLGGAQSFLLRMLSDFPKEHKIFLYDVHPKKRETEILTNLTRDIKIYSSPYERLEMCLKKYPTLFSKILNRLNRYFGLRTKIDKYYFAKILRKKNIDLINSHMYLADSFVTDYSPKKIPKISSFHGCYNFIWNKNQNKSGFSQQQSQIQKILNNYSGVITAADRHNEVFKNYRIIRQNNIRKIYYGFPEKPIAQLDLKKEYNLPQNAFIFGMVARGDITKGWQEAIDAFEKLQKEFDYIYLILSGGTQYLEELKNKYAQNKNIIFTGNINNPLDYISNYDIGLLPTYFPAESLPNTIIEYLYCAKPVVATDWAEISKMIDFEGKKAGEIIPLKNGTADAEKLYSAMKSYLENPEKLKTHSKLSKQAFQKFNMQKCTQAYIEFFEEILNKNE